MMTKDASAFLTAEWRTLLMLNYEINPFLLRSRIPLGTELDIWNGKCFISMVGFRFVKTRLMGIPVPFHVNFDEVNLRFYVRHRHEDEWRRGVVFIKEIVPRWAIALVARWAYNEQYCSMPMRSEIHLPNNSQPGSVVYSWKWQGEWNRMTAQLSGEPEVLNRNSEAAFITEHYWGYAAQKDGSTLEYRVEHPEWRIWSAKNPALTGNFHSLYGNDFASILAGTPRSAFVAEGSPIMVRRGRPTRITQSLNPATT